ncbi:MAG: DUF3526 domain-containing protein [Bryobacterales bacterium]|nr:DUF3526 domain-containing protein [Bryobacterales bacterium]
MPLPITVATVTLRQALRNRSLPAACLLVTALLALSGYVSGRNQDLTNRQRSEYSEKVRSHWLQQPDRHPHRVAHYGYLAFRPKSPLAYFDSGLDSFGGVAVFLEAHRQNTTNFSEAGQSAALIRFGELTPALVLQLIVPLLLFVLGFPVVSGEREGGTLALSLAQGVSSRTLLAGKALGLLAMVPALLLPGMAILLAVRGVPDSGLLPRILALALAYGLYLAVVVWIAAAVSAASRSSRAALTTLLVLWVVACVAMPRALLTLGAARAPLPSKAQFDAMVDRDLAQEGDSHNPNDPHFAQLRARTLQKYGVRDVRDLPFNYSAFVMEESEKITSGIFRRHYSGILDTFQRQSRPLEWGALVNPYLAIRALSMALAGSDLDHFLDFQRQAETFRYDMIQNLNELHRTRIRLENDRAQKVSRDTWGGFPEFVYTPPSVAEVWRRRWTACAVLAAWLALLAVCTLRGRLL